MAGKSIKEEKLETSSSEDSRKSDCIFCEESPNKYSFSKYIIKSPEIPYTKDLLDFAAYAGTPIPQKLGKIMINLLNENISPLAIRNTLHTILNNCSKKRIPVKKTNSVKKLSNPAGGENDGHINYSNINGNYNDDDNDDDNRGNDDNGDDDCESITCGYSMASRYLLENVAYANQNCGGWTYSLRKTGK